MFKNSKTQAFDGLAKNYDQARPTYPVELYQTIFKYWQDSAGQNASGPVIVDAGCGTGISTRAFYNALSGNCKIIGVEPGKDMLATAISVSPEDITYREGTAESIPVESESVDIVTAAQAAQWFNRPNFYREVSRILKPNGVLAIYENNRNWKDSLFLAKHEEFLEENSVDAKTHKHYSRYYRDFPYAKELTENFTASNEFSFFWNRKMSPSGFLEMAKTSTQVKRAEEFIGEARAAELILSNANNHVGEDGQVDVKYNTQLYIARK